MDHANPERIPLEACIEKLRGRREAVGRLQGGHTHFQEELHIFNEAANEQGWFLPTAPAELRLPPSDEGNEHQVWFCEASGTFLKATWPGFFGLRVVYRQAGIPNTLHSPPVTRYPPLRHRRVPPSNIQNLSLTSLLPDVDLDHGNLNYTVVLGEVLGNHEAESKG